jgi:hypothetical protein
VDDHGVPRVRCKCGNPLLEPVAVTTTPTYTGTDWDGFDPTTVVVVRPSDQPVDVLVLVDVDTGQRFERPVGTAGEADAAAPQASTSTTAPATSATSPSTTGVAPGTSATSAAPSTAAPTTAAPTTGAPTTAAPTSPPTTAAPTTRPPVPADVTKEGAVQASSEYPGGQFPAGLALDGDPTTSWFSGGDREGPTSTFTWTHPTDDVITAVQIVGNGANANPAFRRNFGFRTVTVNVLDAGGAVVFTEDRDLPGTPDPDVVVTPNARGRSVQLVFTGHESPDCGGIAELTVTAAR